MFDAKRLRSGKQRLRGLCGALVVLFSIGHSAEAEDFYRGKTISLNVSGTGTFDSWARLVAKYMPKYIPGEPSIVVKSMIGASGLRAANYMFNLAPKDGTEIASVHGQIPTLPLFSREGVQYDPMKFGWLGSVTGGTYVAYAWHTSPVQSMEDAFVKEMIVGGQSVGAIPVDVPVLTDALLGAKIKVVTGYAGAAEDKLAVQRGELNGEFGTLYTTLKSNNPDWLRDQKIKIIAQFGSTKLKELPDVPLLIDYAKTQEARAALEVYLARQATDKPYLAPPGVPAERLEILRDAFSKTVHDPGFLEDAQKIALSVEGPMTGKELTAFLAHSFESSPAAAQRVSAILNAFAKK